MRKEIFKLVSGEDIIAIVEDESDEFFWLSKPYKIVYMPTPDLQMTIGLISWVSGASIFHPIKIKKAHILVNAQVERKVEDYYDKMISGEEVKESKTLIEEKKPEPKLTKVRKKSNDSLVELFLKKTLGESANNVIFESNQEESKPKET